MWYEKLGFEVNINQLRKDVEKYVFTAGNQVIQGEDFDFIYHRGEWDGINQPTEMHTVFEFKEAATATWFSLKYK